MQGNDPPEESGGLPDDGERTADNGRQSDGEHSRNLRRSTAVLEIDAHGRVQWRHLQETWMT